MKRGRWGIITVFVGTVAIFYLVQELLQDFLEVRSLTSMFQARRQYQKSTLATREATCILPASTQKYSFDDDNPCNLNGILSKSFQAEDLHRFQQTCDQVWYNRAMKSGSSRTTLILDGLRKFNDIKLCRPSYNRKQIGREYVPSNRYLSEETMERLVGVMLNVSLPCIDMFHHYLLPFKRFADRHPLMINIIRNPISRLLSHYIFATYNMGDTALERWKGNTTLKGTIEMCARAQKPLEECGQSYLGYFCDVPEICKKRDAAALALSKRNIEEYGIIVGLTEDYRGFFELLDHLLPRFFGHHEIVLDKMEKNWSPEFTNNSFMHEQLTLKMSEVKKLPLLLDTELQLYEFIRQRFYLIKDKISRLSQQLHAMNSEVQ